MASKQKKNQYVVVHNNISVNGSSAPGQSSGTANDGGRGNVISVVNRGGSQGYDGGGGSGGSS